MGPRVGETHGRSTMPVVEQSIDEQLMGVLNDKQLTAHERARSLEDTFKNLPPADAKELHARLKKEIKHDPLSREFHYRFSDSTVKKLVGVLEKQSQTGVTAATPQPPGNQVASPVPDNARKAEVGLQGSLVQMQLNDKLVDGFHLPSDKALRIAENTGMKLEQRKEYLQSMLEKASPEDFKELISGSQNWPDDVKQIFNSAMGQSEKVMERVAKELPSDTQLNVLDRTFNGNEKLFDVDKHENARKVWLENADSGTLNLAVDSAKNPFWAETIRDGIMESGDRMNLIDKLSDTNKSNLLIGVLDSRKSLNKPISNSEANALAHAFQNLEATTKNKTFDQLQNNGLTSELAKQLETRFDQNMLKGLNRENTEFLHKTYSQLAHSAELKKDVDKAIAYREIALHIEGWIENNLPKR